MTGRDLSPPAPTRRRRRLRRIVRVAAVVAAGLIVLAVAGQYWIIPAAIGARLQGRLAHYWGGALEIERIEFSYFGPIRVRGVSLRDAAGRTWVRLRSLSVRLSPWPSTAAKFTRASADDLEVQLHFTDGQCRPPVRHLGELVEWFETKADLKSFRIASAAVATRHWPKRGDTSDECLWDRLEFTSIRQSDGKTYDLVFVRNRPGGASGACGGSIETRLEYHWPLGRPIEYQGAIEAEGLDVQDLLRTAGVELPFLAGRVRLRYKLSGSTLDLLAHRGRGHGVLEAAGPSAVTKPAPTTAPATVQTFAEAEFTVEGARLTIERAWLGAGIVRFDVEPGAGLDLATGQVDLHVRSTPAPGAADLLGPLAPRPRRLRLTGQWRTAEGLKVEPLPP